MSFSYRWTAFCKLTKVLNIQVSEFPLIDENYVFNVYTSAYKIRLLYFKHHFRHNRKFSMQKGHKTQLALGRIEGSSPWGLECCQFSTL